MCPFFLNLTLAISFVRLCFFFTLFSPLSVPCLRAYYLPLSSGSYLPSYFIHSIHIASSLPLPRALPLLLPLTYFWFCHMHLYSFSRPHLLTRFCLSHLPKQFLFHRPIQIFLCFSPILPVFFSSLFPTHCICIYCVSHCQIVILRQFYPSPCLSSLLILFRPYF